MLTQAEADTPLLLEANVHPGSVDSGLIAFPVYGHTIDRSVIGGQGPLRGILHPLVGGVTWQESNETIVNLHLGEMVLI